MSKRLSASVMVLATVALLFNPVLSQEASYLTQKLMVENDIRQKITEALSKIIDEQKYVIDVSVDLEISSERQEQITVAPGSGRSASDQYTETASKIDASAAELEQGYSSEDYLPIPGFEFEVSGPDQSTAKVPEPVQAAGTEDTNGDRILSKVVTDKRAATARIRKMDISLILQEGAAPELIENIRQIVMVASQFKKSRGDALSIMTASFKDRRDQRSAEAIMLKAIADKVDAMEQQRVVESAAAEEDWRTELERYKQEEAQRRQQERSYFQTELGKLEEAARVRTYEQQRQEILERDSVRLRQLNQEIQDLRSRLATAPMTDSEAQETQSRVAAAETERTVLDNQISEKIATLEGVQAELDKIQGGMNDLPLYLMGLLTFLAVVALVIVLVMTNRSKPRYAPPPPWMMQPPPRRKKKRKSASVTEQSAAAPTPPPAPAVKPAAQPAAPQPPTAEDPGVVQSEINDMRKAVVSMSVGQPETATRIVKEWMQEEAPPAPAPQPEVKPSEEAGEEKGKKK